MGADTAIAWTDSTFNPWWGCTKVDPCCTNCYAEKFDKRTGGSHWGPRAERRTFGAAYWKKPLLWNLEAEKERKRRRVFCASMADWADKNAPKGLRERLFALIRETRWLDWLLLSKRADRIAQLLPADWGDGWENVWLGVSVGDLAGRWRLDHLAKIKARYRFVSGEPLLEDLDLSPWLGISGPPWSKKTRPQIDWVIAGAESGNGARPMKEDWVRHLRDQCIAADVGFFYKQQVTDGGRTKIETPLLDGRRWVEPPRRAP